jgi:hypothetical protein
VHFGSTPKDWRSIAGVAYKGNADFNQSVSHLARIASPFHRVTRFKA